MKTRKIIPCMDIRNNKIVKGVKFVDIVQVADPVLMAEFYSNSGADELVLYDIDAAIEKRSVLEELVKNILEKIDIPLCVGGNIRTIEDIKKIIELGVSKVSINTAAIDNPSFINEAVKVFNKEVIVGAVDVKLVNGTAYVFRNGGQTNTEIEALSWICELEKRGVGAIVINSIDYDGMQQGFDLEFLNRVSELVEIPIIASGGAGKKEDFLELFSKTNIEYGLGASVFHYKKIVIDELKDYLLKNKIQVEKNSYEIR